MSSYIESSILQQYAEAPEADSPDVWNQLAEAASRMFDRACEVSDGFFNKAGAEASTKIFRGNGTDYLRLAPYIAETLTLVEWLDDEDAETEVETTDYFERDGYLVYVNAGALGWNAQTAYSSGSYFRTDRRYRVTARWGFTEIPADVKQAVIELALFIWRRKDFAFADMSNVSTAIATAALPPTTEMIAQKYKEKYSENGYFA